MARREGILSSGLRLGVGLSICAIALVGISSLGLLPGLPNPFESDSVDRNQPSSSRASRTSASTAPPVGISRSSWIPRRTHGSSRALFSASAPCCQQWARSRPTVDFSGISEGAVQVDGDAVTITVPEPTLNEARLDNEQTEVIDRDRGLLNRIGGIVSSDPVDDQDLYVAAENKLERAAEDSELLDRARENTRKMLRGLAADLGYTDVTVVFEPPPGDRA